MAVALAAVVVVPLTVGASVLVASSGTKSPKAVPVDVAEVVADPQAFSDCPDPEQTDRTGEVLPDGIVAVRLCATTKDGRKDFQAPQELLTSNVQQVRRLVNGAAQGTDPDCSLEPVGLAYALAMSYPDGAIRVVEGRSSGCNELRVGEASKLIARDVWERVIALLAAQRQDMTPPVAQPARPDCPELSDLGLPTSPLGTFDEVVRANFCAANFQENNRPGPTFSTPIPAPDLRAIQAGIANAQGALGTLNEAAGKCRAPELTYVIYGRTRWGDTVALPSTFCALPVADGFWLPQGPTKTVLDRLIGRSGVLGSAERLG